MPRYLRFEIAQARPPQSFVQIDFGHNHGPPLFGVNELIARVIINGGEHPLARDVLVSAADEVDVIFAGARRGQQRVATPHRPLLLLAHPTVEIFAHELIVVQMRVAGADAINLFHLPG